MEYCCSLAFASCATGTVLGLVAIDDSVMKIGPAVVLGRLANLETVTTAGRGGAVGRGGDVTAGGCDM